MWINYDSSSTMLWPGMIGIGPSKMYQSVRAVEIDSLLGALSELGQQAVTCMNCLYTANGNRDPPGVRHKIQTFLYGQKTTWSQKASFHSEKNNISTSCTRQILVS